VVREPPEGRQEHELHVGQVVRCQRRPDRALPGQGGAPEQEPRAPLWCGKQRAWSPGGYRARSLASAIKDAIVSGKSAVIIGPIS
jgi:hypothetical protein